MTELGGPVKEPPCKCCGCSERHLAGCPADYSTIPKEKKA